MSRPPSRGSRSSLLTAKVAKLGLFATRTSGHVFASNRLRVLLAALAYVLIERMCALALQGTELAKAQIDTLRIKLLKLAAAVTRNTRRIKHSRRGAASMRPIRRAAGSLQAKTSIATLQLRRS